VLFIGPAAEWFKVSRVNGGNGRLDIVFGLLVGWWKKVSNCENSEVRENCEWTAADSTGQ